jgi:hypothetical protein
MSKLLRVIGLTTALASLFAMMSSTAGAITFSNTGGTSLHATGGGVTLLPTRHPGVGSNLGCGSSTWTGNVPAGAFLSASGTLTYSGCALVGTPVHIDCTYTLIPTTWTNATQAITSLTASLTCAMSAGGTPFCHIEGSTPGHYFNPDPPNTIGRLTLTRSSSLTITHSSFTNCLFLGTTASGPVHMTEQTVTLAGPASSNPFIVSP